MNTYEQIRKALLDASIALSSATHNDLTEYDAQECLTKVDAALAIPRRNCDVGTAEEQKKRFTDYCSSKFTFRKCLLSNCSLCIFAWAQLPYEEAKR